MNDPTSKTYIGMVAATNERWADPTFKKFMSDTATISTTRRWKTKKYRNIMIKSVRKQWYTTNSKLRESIRTSNKHFRPSSLELKFKVMLDEVGILYKQQYRPYDYNRFYDFFLVDYDTLIEIDGYHWHHSEWAISRGSPVSDAEKDEWAVTHGFDMVRIPEKYVVPTIVKEWLVPKVLGITL
jgi:very-short-patch-repair endonuclease